MVGLTTLGTMKMTGKLGSRAVMVLVDCGATHNFLSLELVNELELPITSTTNYGVVMGTGESVKGKGICKGVVLEIQNIQAVEDFLPLELGSTDVILGMQWLGELGMMEVD